MVPPLLAAAVAKPVPIWMCFGILDVGEGRMREEEVLKADGRSICNGKQHLTRKCSGSTLLLENWDSSQMIDKFHSMFHLILSTAGDHAVHRVQFIGLHLLLSHLKRAQTQSCLPYLYVSSMVV